MREIKFRAWYKNNYKKTSKLKYDFAVWCGQYLEIIANENFVGPNEDYILMQYTGLKDANGKEIYEGDIVKYFEWSKEPTYTEVKWQDDLTGFYPFADSPKNSIRDNWSINSLGVEVVGNIYENPELLESNGQVK
jgi:uncharacterized phage protein (TIGR01671 family)